MPLYTEGSRGGVPVAYNFVYGGAAVGWGSTSLTEMGDVSCRAEPLDGKFSVSELRTTFSDTNGSIWGSLGHGTSGLGSSWAATAYIGGNMGEQGYGPNGTRLARLNTTGAGTYVIHMGRITEISRKNRMVEVVSQNLMSQVEDLEWRFPVGTLQAFDGALPAWNALYGYNFFLPSHAMTGYFSNYGSAYFNVNTDKDQFEVYAYMGSNKPSEITNFYPTPTDRGTMGVLPGFVYPGTQFYYDYNRFHFKGSFLGTYIGTITNEDQARALGYAELGAAETARGAGTRYVIMKTRLTVNTDGDMSFPNGSAFYLQQGGIYLEDSPAKLWKEMLTGCCVTPLFGSETIDAAAYTLAIRNTGFQNFSQVIEPKGGDVFPGLKNMLAPLRCLFSTSPQNKFRLHTFGPRSGGDVVGTLGMSEIINSSVSVDTKDKYNRLEFEYGYAPLTGSYSRRLSLKATTWGSTNDFPLKLQSKWLNNDNDANITGLRILRRFSAGMPRLELDVPLKHLTAEIGSLYAVTDVDLGYTNRYYEVVGWSRDFGGDKTMHLSLWDGDALYRGKGYAFWEGDNNLAAAVSGTSLSGWGTNGTVNNINTAFNGTRFNWF